MTRDNDIGPISLVEGALNDDPMAKSFLNHKDGLSAVLHALRNKNEMSNNHPRDTIVDFSTAINFCNSYVHDALSACEVYNNYGNSNTFWLGEESITDFLLLELIRTHSLDLCVQKFNKRQEGDDGIGADWDWWLFEENDNHFKAIGLRFQAKIIKQDQRSYSSVKRTVSSTGNQQVDDIINSSASDNMLPLYVFFNLFNSDAHEHLENSGDAQEDLSKYCFSIASALKVKELVDGPRLQSKDLISIQQSFLSFVEHTPISIDFLAECFAEKLNFEDSFVQRCVYTNKDDLPNMVQNMVNSVAAPRSGESHFLDTAMQTEILSQAEPVLEETSPQPTYYSDAILVWKIG